MEAIIIAIIAGVVVLALFLMIGTRLLRFAIRMLLAIIVLIVVLGAASFAWWSGWFDKSPAGKSPSRPASTRRVSSH